MSPCSGPEDQTDFTLLVHEKGPGSNTAVGIRSLYDGRSVGWLLDPSGFRVSLEVYSGMPRDYWSRYRTGCL